MLLSDQHKTIIYSTPRNTPAMWGALCGELRTHSTLRTLFNRDWPGFEAWPAYFRGWWELCLILRTWPPVCHVELTTLASEDGVLSWLRKCVGCAQYGVGHLVGPH